MPTTTSNPSKNKEKAGPLQGLSSLPAHPAGAARKKVLAAFLKTAGIRFKSMELLNLSFMHRSISNELDRKVNNERLEFLGDSILGAVTATLLYKRLSDRPEGDLAKIKSVVVSEDILSGVARELQIDSLLILGKGEENSGGRSKNAILADALEALIGALYLDSGYKAAYNFVVSFMDTEISRVLDNRHHQDYKSLLQELCQRLYHSYPVYRLLKRSGPDHARLFWMEVAISTGSPAGTTGNTYGPGAGRNKNTAEQEAAKIAYEALEKAGFE
jgi:ribonuclease-3